MSIVLGIALWISAAADASPVNVYVTLDPPVIPFHRQAQYTVVAEAPNDVEVKLPDMVDKFGGLGVADIRRNTQSIKGGRRRISETYVLDPIFAGNYRIQPAQVSWGETEGVTTPSPALRVRDLTPEEKEAAMQFTDIAGPPPIKGVLSRYWQVWAAVGAAVLPALAVLAYLYRRRQREIRLAPPPPPWEVAYQRLRELDQRQLPKAGKYGPYYVDLSAILRYYIEDRFHVHAPEQTTPEFLAVASGSGLFTDDQQKLISGFLRHSDRVKFAQYVPTLPEMDRCFAVVLQFVDETVPRPAPEQEEAAA
jgi:hypothetical protein